MTALRPYAAAALLAAACSGPGDPGEVTTWDQVQPLLASNCVRCHGAPSIDGAPDTFRLDVYEDVVLDDRGDQDPYNDYVLRGARSLRAAMAIRTDPALAESRGFELMPPTVHMEDYGHLILEGWFGGERADRPGNAPPTIAVTVGEPDASGVLAIGFEIRDADHDMVRGQLTADGVPIGELHSGRGTVVWDTGVMPDGDHVLRARLDDGGGEGVLQRRVAEVPVDRGNVAPLVRIIEPGPFALLTDGDVPSVMIDVVDPDDSTLALFVEAFRGTEQVTLFDGNAGVGRQAIPWPDFASMDDGGGWRIRVVANDGAVRQTISATPFRVSHATTTESAVFFDTLVNDPAESRCSDSNCHNDPGEGVFRLTTLGDPRTDTSLRGRIYRRVVELENMPPPHKGEPYRLDAAERARIGDWLLGGAPP
jgi:hypothetical protein